MVDPTNPTAEIEQPRPVDVFQREVAIPREFTEEETGHIIRRLGSLTLDDATHLHDYQVEALEDMVASFAAGAMENYTLQPTGVGKTVEFVTLAKLFIDASKEEGRQARVLVLEPKVDLTVQTVGSVDEVTGKRRGFKGFAPELDARPLHGKMKAKQRLENMSEADVLVTTYNTFRNMVDNLGTLDTVDRADLVDEIAEHTTAVHDAMRGKEAAIEERVEFIRTTYLRQEVDRVDKMVTDTLFGDDNDLELSKKQSDALRGILVILHTDEPAADKLKNINRQMKVLSNWKIKSQVALMEQAAAARRARIKSELDQTEKTGSDYVVEREFIIAREKSDDQIEDEGAESLQLNKLERFVAGYIYRHKAGTVPSPSKLIHQKDRDALGLLNSKVENQRAAVRFNKAKKLEKEGLLVLVDAIEQYDLIICDEVHRVMGTETWAAIQEFAKRKGIAIAGFTATDAYYDRKLDQFIGTKAHELTRQEAIDRNITNPVAMFVHETGLRFEGVSLDASGDYDVATLRSMRLSDERNKIGVNYLKLIAEAGYHGIASAIPGDEGAHAKVLSDLANGTEMLDPVTGELRPMKTVYVLSKTPPDVRQEYYAQLERKEIDWIVFVDVIGEGWDSDTAKAIFNFRPTTSLLNAIQRTGRVGRRYEGAPISIVFDLFDGIASEEFHTEIPPVLGVDIYDLDDVEQGYVVGEHPDKESGFLQALRAKLPYKMKAHHSRFVKAMEEMVVIDANGFVLTKAGTTYAREWQDYRGLLRTFKGYLPKELLLDELDSEDPQLRVIKGRRGIGVVPLFNVRDVEKLHRDAPEINPSKLYVDPSDGQNWITAEGCTILLSKKFPEISAEEVSEALKAVEELTETKFAKQVARIPIFYTTQMETKSGFDLMYKMDEIVDRLVPYLLENTAKG